jgi:hypothetical protein
MFTVIKQKRSAKRLIKHLMKLHSAVSAEQEDLSGTALYREILLRTQQLDGPGADEMLWQAEDSVDEWTDRSGHGLNFRQVVHFYVTAQQHEGSQPGIDFSLRKMVDALVPANL